jgi:hypothetical protein
VSKTGSPGIAVMAHQYDRVMEQAWPRPTLLGKSRWPISNAKGVRVTRDMGSVSLTFERCVSVRFSARF